MTTNHSLATPYSKEKSNPRNLHAEPAQIDQNKAESLNADISPDSAEYQDIYKKLFGSLPRNVGSESTHEHAHDKSENDSVSTLKIFDHGIVKELSERPSIGREERKFYSSLLPEHAEKPLIVPTDETFARFEKLFVDFPNAEELLNYVQDFLHLRSISSNKPIYLPAVLIAGQPGIGKTQIVTSICKALDVEYGFYDFSSASSSWGLTGQDSGWNGSHIGLVARKLLYGKCANPILHLDELCKGIVNLNTDPYLALHTLLERPQMRQFHDAYAQNLPINASYVSFFATANNLQAIAPSVLSRFRIIEMQPPSPSQMRHIAGNMYRLKLLEEGVDQAFCPTLDEPVVDYFLNKTPREAGLILARGIASAAKRKPEIGSLRVLRLEDLSDCAVQETQERKVGFVW
ncbi:MAG: AAA family ATPase [Methylomonas sp.]|nr:AAA family ATPase [Methylomonas sp.]PPD50531.1 MAG: hypothetical protein CTY13_01555 [Methylobacter sp.]PPD53532.1 MAG: hypothetical protein CTY12_04750 [Methylotenera sp.]